MRDSPDELLKRYEQIMERDRERGEAIIKLTESQKTMRDDLDGTPARPGIGPRLSRVELQVQILDKKMLLFSTIGAALGSLIIQLGIHYIKQ